MNSIHSDYTGMFVARQMNLHTADAGQALERIASGYRINSAADDPASLGVSERMRAEVTGLEAAAENARAGQDMINVVEGALTEVHSMLNRLADIAGRAANGTLDVAQRKSLQREADELLAEINRVANAARWGDKPLLNGDPEHGKVVLQVGTGNEEYDRITVQMPNLSEILGGLEGLSVLTPEAASASIKRINTVIDGVSAARAQLGAAHNRLKYTVNNLSNTAENLQSAESRMRDADIAKEMSRFVRSTTLAQAAQMVFSHSLQARYRILQLLRSMY